MGCAQETVSFAFMDLQEFAHHCINCRSQLAWSGSYCVKLAGEDAIDTYAKGSLTLGSTLAGQLLGCEHVDDNIADGAALNGKRR